MRRRNSAAIMVAALALIAAVAGTALAGSGPDANSSGAAKDAKKALKLAKKNKKKIKNIELTPGPQGTDGQDGADGAENAASIVTGRGDPLGALTPPAYFRPVGDSTGAVMESDVTTLSPSRAIVAKDLAVEVDTAPGPPAPITFTLRANATGGLTCTVTDPATTCNSGSQSMMIPAGAQMSLEASAPMPPISVVGMFGWRPESL